MEERQGEVTFQGNPLTLVGEKIQVGHKAPGFKLLATDMTEVELATLREIETSFQFNNAIIRNLVINKRNAVTKPSPLAKTEDEGETAAKKPEAEKKSGKGEAEAKDDQQSKEEAA